MVWPDLKKVKNLRCRSWGTRSLPPQASELGPGLCPSCVPCYRHLLGFILMQNNSNLFTKKTPWWLLWWLSVCFFKWSLREKLFPQRPHLCFLSPVWIRKCLCNSSDLNKSFFWKNEIFRRISWPGKPPDTAGPTAKIGLVPNVPAQVSSQVRSLLVDLSTVGIVAQVHGRLSSRSGDWLLILVDSQLVECLYWFSDEANVYMLELTACWIVCIDWVLRDCQTCLDPCRVGIDIFHISYTLKSSKIGNFIFLLFLLLLNKVV